MNFISHRKMRNVRRLEDGAFTASPSASPNEICEPCGIRSTCQIFRYIQGVKAAAIRVQSCHLFMPVLAFQLPLVGAEGRFNTIRLGEAWSKRVEPGKTVIGMVESTNDTLIAYALVEEMYVCNLDNAVRWHAAKNHNAIGLGDVSDAEARIFMRRRLGRRYGGMMTDDSLFTVLYLKRLKDAPGAYEPKKQPRKAP